MITRKVFVVGMALMLLGAAPRAEAMAPDPLEEVRELFLLASEDESGIQPGLAAIAATRSESGLSEGDVALLEAYEGALIGLRSKYVFWPTTRMRHLNQGLAVLDRLVKARPEDSEIRYLRLMSCYYLPSFLGRSATVREDFSALARTLPADEAEIPTDLYRGIVRFLIDNGKLVSEQIRPLEASLR